MTHHHHGLSLGNLCQFSGGHRLERFDHLVSSPDELRNCLAEYANEKRSHQLPDRTASLKNSFISLARSLGIFLVLKFHYPCELFQSQNVSEFY